MNDKAASPERETPLHIYLQDGCDDPECDDPHTYHEGVSWCTDPVHDNDTKYIRFDVHERELAALECLERIKAGAGAFDQLPADVVKMCKHRGWSLHWTHRGAYLHLEASELIEAIRGKHGDPLKEAADVLLVLMSITEGAGIPWEAVMDRVRTVCDELMDRPHYPGEEYSADSETRLQAAEGIVRELVKELHVRCSFSHIPATAERQWFMLHIQGIRKFVSDWENSEAARLFLAEPDSDPKRPIND